MQYAANMHGIFFGIQRWMTRSPTPFDSLPTNVQWQRRIAQCLPLPLVDSSKRLHTTTGSAMCDAMQFAAVFAFPTNRYPCIPAIFCNA